MDGPERGIGSGGECCGLFCFVFTFTFIFALTFSSRGVRGTGVSAVGGLGSEGDKTVLLGPKNWNPISSSKCRVLARHG